MKKVLLATILALILIGTLGAVLFTYASQPHQTALSPTTTLSAAQVTTIVEIIPPTTAPPSPAVQAVNKCGSLAIVNWHNITEPNSEFVLYLDPTTGSTAAFSCDYLQADLIRGKSWSVEQADFKNSLNTPLAKPKATTCPQHSGQTACFEYEVQKSRDANAYTAYGVAIKSDTAVCEISYAGVDEESLQAVKTAITANLVCG